MRTNRILWNVDSQEDFLRPPSQGGRLYVKNLFDDSDPGSETIIPTLKRAVETIAPHAAVRVDTGDWHEEADEEIDAVAPDATQGTYPPHCMGLSPDPEEARGALVIEEIRAPRYLTLEREASPEEARALADQAVGERTPVFVQKSRFNVFEGSRGADALLERLVERLGGRGAVEIVVVGVARDVCVTQFVDGALARGYRVTVLTDATYGLGLESEDATLDRWRSAGARLTTLERYREEIA